METTFTHTTVKRIADAFGVGIFDHGPIGDDGRWFVDLDPVAEDRLIDFDNPDELAYIGVTLSTGLRQDTETIETAIVRRIEIHLLNSEGDVVDLGTWEAGAVSTFTSATAEAIIEYAIEVAR